LPALKSKESGDFVTVAFKSVKNKIQDFVASVKAFFSAPALNLALA